MNINEALYRPDLVRAEFGRRIAEGATPDGAISEMADDVLRTTEAESRRGVVHGVVKQLDAKDLT